MNYIETPELKNIEIDYDNNSVKLNYMINGINKTIQTSSNDVDSVLFIIKNLFGHRNIKIEKNDAITTPELAPFKKEFEIEQ